MTDTTSTFDVASTPEWESYLAEPSLHLASLMRVASTTARPRLVRAIELAYFNTGDWRFAQHAALLHLDAFAPRVGQVDLLRALYFSLKAVELSGGDSRARLALARVNWERRVPRAVLWDTARALRRLPADGLDAAVERRIRGELLTLECISRAYLGQLEDATVCLDQANQSGGPTIEALHHVIESSCAFEPRFPRAAMFACRLLPDGFVPAERFGGQLLTVQRFRLVILLANKVRS